MPFSQSEELSDIGRGSGIFTTSGSRCRFIGRGLIDGASMGSFRPGDIGEVISLCPKVDGCLAVFRAVSLSESCFFSFTGDVPEKTGLFDKPLSVGRTFE